MLTVTANQNDLNFGEGFGLNFQRTLRIPDDGKTYPLPPGLGTFPICKIADYPGRVPEEWTKHGGVFIPMYQREALWISFSSRHWKPNAVKVAVGKVNAVSGKPWDQQLQTGKEDYLVCPPQIWLDGINAGDGFIRQFVAMPLGMGYTVESQVTGKEEFGGIQLIVYEPKPGKFPDKPPPPLLYHRAMSAAPVPMAVSAFAGGEMGIAAGGKMKQHIYPDPHGIDTWDQDNFGRVYVHIVNSMMYQEITGRQPPSTPISAKTYSQHGFPWFDLYDDGLGDITAPENLSKVKSVKDIDAEKGFTPQQDDSPVNVPDDLVVKYKTKPANSNELKDGDW
jgi:hypothetical protein